jgi:hypothetical protein
MNTDERGSEEHNLPLINADLKDGENLKTKTF